MDDILFVLRYIPGTKHGDAFPSIRYPWTHGVPYERAEMMRQAMPEPDKFEIVRLGE